jgi:expansin (peptidoglycan-binding protein)
VSKRWLVGSAAAVVLTVGLAAFLQEGLLRDEEATAGHKPAARLAAVPAPNTPSDGVPANVAPTARSLKTASASAARPPAGAGSSAKPRVAPLAGRIRPNVTYRGKATFYDAGDGNGACLFGPADTTMTAAMNQTDYESAKACGAYVRVRTANGAAVTVRITNLCPLPCAPGQIDLSRQAFAKLAKPSLGEVPITWKLLSPPLTTKISIRYQTGSSQWWCGLQVINHRNPIARLEVRTRNGWRRLPRASHNYFISAHGDGCGGAIRATDIHGQRLTFTGVKISPDVAQPTDKQFTRR